MDRSLKLHLTVCMVMSLFLWVFPREVTVRQDKLHICTDRSAACVTDLDDCKPPPPTAIQKTLNMSCYYQNNPKDRNRTLTCAWTEESDGHTESKVSLIISRTKIRSCGAVILPIAVFNVTARIKDYRTGSEIWSQPLTVNLRHAFKPFPPVLTVLNSSDHSLSVSWSCDYNCNCRLRYRVNNTRTWTTAPELISGRHTLTHTIVGLPPSTVYRAAVSCTEGSKFWSDWSSEIPVRTLERAPSKPPEVCYRVENTDSADRLQLHLMWKDLDLLDAGAHVLGYQVSYEPMRKRDKLIQNVTEVTALLVVKAGNCSVAVRAFNAAGYGPAAHLSIDTRRQKTLPSVRHLWASTSSDGLRVQWEAPTAPLPVSHFAVQWRSETQPSTSCWATVDNISTSAVIQDVDPEETYMIRVIPVYNHWTGSPQSLPVTLQQGALMEVVRLSVLRVTKTTVTVVWAWQRKSGPFRVDGYRVMMRRDSEEQTLSLWPDQWQHTFTNLIANTEYSLLLLADNMSRSSVTVTTDFDEIPAVAAVSGLLLLFASVCIISILFRTEYKSYFFPPISSPQWSKTGQWLMDPNHQKTAEKNILDVEDFQVLEVLGQKSFITMSPPCERSLEEEERKEANLLSIKQLLIKLDQNYVSDAPMFTEPLLLSLQTPYHPVYSVTCSYNDREQDQDQDQEVVLPAGRCEADADT